MPTIRASVILNTMAAVAVPRPLGKEAHKRLGRRILRSDGHINPCVGAVLPVANLESE